MQLATASAVTRWKRSAPARVDWEALYGAECSQLRAANLRITKARVQTLRALNADQARHVCVEALFRVMLQQASDIKLCTLYRILTEFMGAGLVCALASGSGKLLYERNDRPGHHHLHCLRCGGVTDVFDSVLGEVQARVARAHGFAAGSGVALYGECASCASPAGAGADPA